MASLAGRVALITGATRGFGAALAKAVAAEGAHVIACGRTQGALEALDDAIRKAGGAATLAPFDLKDVDAIDRLAAGVLERWGKLDVLVGNAALLGRLTPMAHVPPNVWDEVMTVNVTANYRLIRALEPLLAASDAGRAVFVTSGVAAAPRAFWGPYAVSKAALEAMVRTWADELEKSSVRVNLFSPGRMRTKMRAQAMPGEDPATLPAPEDVVPELLPLLRPDCAQHGQVVAPR